jgi:hypothetical protein
MKNFLFPLLSLLLFSFSTLSTGNEIAPPAEGKAVVYFARTASMGILINFSYFDKDKFIGKFHGHGYIRYECEPGEHVFWAKSENSDFITADLEAGKIYFVEALPKMGGLKARVRLMPVNPAQDMKMMKVIESMVSKKDGETYTADYLQTENEKWKEDIQRGMERYQEMVTKQEKVERLSKEMFYVKTAAADSSK